MAIDDLSKKASDLAGKAGDLARDNADKIDQVLKSEQAEKVSDSVLDGAAGLANKLTGGKFADQVEGVRKNLDDQIGNQ